MGLGSRVSWLRVFRGLGFQQREHASFVVRVHYMLLMAVCTMKQFRKIELQ